MSGKIQEVQARRAELMGDEVKIAERIHEFMLLLEKIREAAGAGVDPPLLVEQIKRIDPAMLSGAASWLRLFIVERFTAEHRDIASRVQKIEAAKAKVCPYTRAEYDAAVAKVGTKQEALALKLKVDRATLRKYGRPEQ